MRDRLGLHPRSARDFFDALVALGMLEREDGRYRNTPETDLFLDRAKPSYQGGLLEMLNARLFGFWNNLTEGLRTGEPQNEAKTGAGNLFEAIYNDPGLLRGFARAMTASSMGPAMVMASKFPWDRHQTVIDIGCAEGCVPVAVAQRPRAHARRRIRSPADRAALRGVRGGSRAERPAEFQPGDFFADRCRRQTSW